MQIECDALEFDGKPWAVGETRYYPPIAGGCVFCSSRGDKCRFMKARKRWKGDSGIGGHSQNGNGFGQG